MPLIPHSKNPASRRDFLTLSAGIMGMTALGLSSSKFAFATNSEEKFEITRSIKEWKSLLTPNQFAVLREESTERRNTSPLLAEKREGNYHCAGCDLPAYPSATKYESGTGWPSFWDALPDAIRTKEDNGLFSTRTEVHCRRCGGHFGHIFNDGPKPTGKRHCLNGLALQFQPTVS